MDEPDLVNFWKSSTSIVWKYFGFESEIVDGTKKIIEKKTVCKICKAKLTYSGPTTNLSNHLRLKHKIFSNSATSDTSNDHSKQASIKVHLELFHL